MELFAFAAAHACASLEVVADYLGANTPLIMEAQGGWPASSALCLGWRAPAGTFGACLASPAAEWPWLRCRQQLWQSPPQSRTPPAAGGYILFEKEELCGARPLRLGTVQRFVDEADPACRRFVASHAAALQGLNRCAFAAVLYCPASLGTCLIVTCCCPPALLQEGAGGLLVIPENDTVFEALRTGEPAC